MAHRLYSVSVLWSSGIPKVEDVDRVLSISVGDEWIRFSPTQWFVWTSKTTENLTQLLRGAVLPHNQCVVCALSLEAADGAAPEWVWKWLNDKMYHQLMQQHGGGT